MSRIEPNKAVIHPPEDSLVAFISHSWKDGFLPERIEDLLHSENIQCRFDRSNLTLGDELGLGISQMLAESDFIVSLLTENSVKSLAVREELTRAHERRRRIFPIVQKEVIATLPSFIRESFFLTFSDVSDISAKVLELINHILKHRSSLLAERIYHRIFEMQEHVSGIKYKKEKFDAKDAMLFDQATSVLFECQEELSSLSEGKYRTLITPSSSFLKRCRPVFEHASELYAVSRDDVSDFWTSRSTEDAELAQEYLQANPKESIRLFVFKDAASAYAHTHILNIHHRFYGTTGGVLITNRAEYEHMLKEWGMGSYVAERDADFAILTFKGRENVHYEASLGEGHFNVRSLGSRLGPAHSRLRDNFRGFCEMAHGAIHHEYNVARWRLDYQNTPNEYSDFLMQLFKGHNGSAFHVVLFRGIEDRDKLKYLLQINVSAILSDLPQDHLIRKTLLGFWVCSGFDPHAHEPRTSGRILVQSNQWPTALIMQFSQEDGIKAWQELVAHSNLREDAHNMFSPVFEEMYSEIVDLINRGCRDSDLARKYEDIEAASVEYMNRLDYRDAMTLSELVHRRAVRPPIRIQPSHTS